MRLVHTRTSCCTTANCLYHFTILNGIHYALSFLQEREDYKTYRKFSILNFECFYFYSQALMNNKRSTLFKKSYIDLIVKSCGKSIQPRAANCSLALCRLLQRSAQQAEWMGSIGCDTSGTQTDISSSVSSMEHTVAILQTSLSLSLSFLRGVRVSNRVRNAF